MKTGTGTFKLSHRGSTGLIYIPAKIVVDSAFPLKEGKVIIEVTDSEIIIKPA